MPSPTIGEFRLPQSVIAARRSVITPEEVRDALLYEVQLVMNSIHFFLQLQILASILCFDVAALTVGAILLYLPWFLWKSAWAAGNRKSRKVLKSFLHPRFWVNAGYAIALTTNACSADVNQLFRLNAIVNTLWGLNFHPHFQVLLQAPLADVHVRAGLLGLALMWAVYHLTGQAEALPPDHFSLRLLTRSFLFLLFGSAVAGTTAFAVRAAVKAGETVRKFKVFSPWIDVPLAIRNVLKFRSSTNLKLSAFIRLLDAHTDSDDALSVGTPDVLHLETLVEWMGEERGVDTWKFLTSWKSVRLGKIVTESDLLVPADILANLEVRKTLASMDTETLAPLRSPLLRGY